ncbi:hypothetical protein EVAR_12616_1 [Eumeta japonica]|uniref:Gustatory receptor n=1 Tax=Eumeta variegata TaxID=151549 RepID=A0A4C1UF25_EUMVA|nr:hypothetical protein EVAR_12616_1 [Eumeta japonica]
MNKYELRRHRVEPNSYRYLLTSVVVNAVAITNFYFVLSSYNFDAAHFIDYMSTVQIIIVFWSRSRNPEESPSALTASRVGIGYLGKGNRLSELLLTGRKATAEVVTARLYSARMRYFSGHIDSFSCDSQLDYSMEKDFEAFSFIWGFVVWTTKELFMLILVSAMYEKVYTRIEKLKRACAVLCENRSDVTLRRTAKNVIRLCSVRHAKIRVFSLFAVDAVLPLRLAGLLATYCIVLLQFAFL